jgi:hypothetical protein
MKKTLKMLKPAVAGVGLLFSPTLIDFLISDNEFKARHSFLLGSVASLANFLAIAYFFSIFIRDRNATKQNRISTVAYRSLSQAANDALRKLLAPLNGANLFELALYEEPSEIWAENRKRLKKLKRIPPFVETKGLWEHAEDPYLKETLVILMRDKDYLKEFYILNARVRREVQLTTGLWSPVMFTSSTLEKDLGRFRELSDDLEFLQELWRKVLSDESTEGSLLEAQAQFWLTVHTAFGIAREFAFKGAMPSLERQVRVLPELDT